MAAGTAHKLFERIPIGKIGSPEENIMRIRIAGRYKAINIMRYAQLSLLARLLLEDTFP
jgi:hypothetical protein